MSEKSKDVLGVVLVIVFFFILLKIDWGHGGGGNLEKETLTSLGNDIFLCDLDYEEKELLDCYQESLGKAGVR